MSSPEPVIVRIDGASRGNPGPSGIGVVFLGADGSPTLELSKYLGETTNNVAEYLALLYALQEAQVRGFTRLHVKTDSELLAKQLHGEYKIKEENLQKLFIELWNLKLDFGEVVFKHVPREENKEADRMVNYALDRELNKLL